MLLEQTEKRNKKLLEAAFHFHQMGTIRPDSYLVDVDMLMENARAMLTESKKYGITLYFMLKQLGRNPYIAKKLMALGYSGAVVVDFKEAKTMMDHQIPIGNIGHLVQIPNAMLEEVILYQPQIITVYSIEKVKQINVICEKLGLIQPLMIRVYDKKDKLYSGQEAGFSLHKLPELVDEVKQLKGVVIEGITAFPTLLYQEATGSIEPTSNMTTILEAKRIFKHHHINIKQVNFPSATCCLSIEKIACFGGTHGEPGHGLSGTTPLHANGSQVEIPCVVYVSEISHNFDKHAYFYGGGHYRRSHVKAAYVGKNLQDAKQVNIIPPEDDAIDYHLALDQEAIVGDSVVTAFRYQIFVTRSDVVLIEGLHQGKEVKIIGRYDSQGREL